MKRLELFEFEDFSWLPKFIRTSVTNLIIVFHRMVGTADVLVDLIKACREKIQFKQIIDLGSGSGGPMPEVIQKINEENKNQEVVKLKLSDKFPNERIVKSINDQALQNVEYLSHSVDASELENAPNGLKTMIASFHHMPPKMAQKMLSSAEDNKEPILIYELAENNVPVIIWVLLLPISLPILVVMCLFMTPFVKPLTFAQLLFTYLIPVIPLIYAWDGQASLMRTYTFEDIKSLIGKDKKENYTWEISQAKKKNGKRAGYYILGYSPN